MKIPFPSPPPITPTCNMLEAICPNSWRLPAKTTPPSRKISKHNSQLPRKRASTFAINYEALPGVRSRCYTVRSAFSLGPICQEQCQQTSVQDTWEIGTPFGASVEHVPHNEKRIIHTKRNGGRLCSRTSSLVGGSRRCKDKRNAPRGVLGVVKFRLTTGCPNFY